MSTPMHAVGRPQEPLDPAVIRLIDALARSMAAEDHERETKSDLYRSRVAVGVSKVTIPIEPDVIAAYASDTDIIGYVDEQGAG